jgi:hypothetical protein
MSRRKWTEKMKNNERLTTSSCGKASGKIKQIKFSRNLGWPEDFIPPDLPAFQLVDSP